MSNAMQENFEKALETIDALSEQNQALMDQIKDLNFKLSLSENEIKPPKATLSAADEKRYRQTAENAEAAMNRYKQFLKKEFPNAKSKQTKRQSV